jgi:hypothetical protein
MLYGDRWERATREADRRLGWPTNAAARAEAHDGA